MVQTTTSPRSPTGFWAGVPRGVRPGRGELPLRHRIISAVLALHPPVLAAIGAGPRRRRVLLWGQLAAIVVLLVAGQVLRSQVARASAVSLGLMVGADVLVHVAAA